MLIGNISKEYLKQFRKKSKMIEYNVESNFHNIIPDEANDLIILCIGILGEAAYEIWSSNYEPIIINEDLQQELIFASSFFDYYYQSNIDKSTNGYYVLLGAVSYYFGNMNGNSKVMINILEQYKNFEFDASGLENVIIWLLNDQYSLDIIDIDEKYKQSILKIINIHNNFFNNYNINVSENLKSLNSTLSNIFTIGNSREILFMNIILAILKKKIINSALYLMPRYSKKLKSEWFDILKNNSQLKEMWLSQIQLGEADIYNGNSGLIQMPTNSGKTTAISLIIASHFLNQKSNLVIIIAPFKSLCREIKEDLMNFFNYDSDILISECSNLDNIENNNYHSIKNIFILTPEKFLYIIKRNKEILDAISLIIFDEAHLFDDISRGTDYELLLTMINYYLNDNIQKLLISAMISNPNQLNNWFNKNTNVIKNNTPTTNKNIAINKNECLSFTDQKNNLHEEFYLPNMIAQTNLKKYPKERKNRYFPENEQKDIALYYSLNLINNGCVAIYTPRKNMIDPFIKRIKEVEDRGISLDPILNMSDKSECKKISYLISKHYGNDLLSSIALKGIFVHHSDIPLGIQLSEEYALKKGLIKYIILTSTLAQGVNIPIKYLIITGLHIGKNMIKVRDFYNLIGRTARNGHEIDGTIILTSNFKDKAKNVINSDKIEPCSSNLLYLVKEINNPQIQLNMSQLKQLIEIRYTNTKQYNEIKKQLNEKSLEFIDNTEKIIISLENFMITVDDNIDIIDLTYGYFLANDEEKEELKFIISIIDKNIQNIDMEIPKIVYSKTALGYLQMQNLILDMHKDECKDIFANGIYDELLKFIVKQLSYFRDSKIENKLSINQTFEILKLWLNGESFFAIHQSTNIRMNLITHLCLNEFSYNATILLTSIVDILELQKSVPNDDHVLYTLKDILYRIKYGLPNISCCFIYELGFSDRMISKEIYNILGKNYYENKNKCRREILNNKSIIQKILNDYPSFFTHQLNKL